MDKTKRSGKFLAVLLALVLLLSVVPFSAFATVGTTTAQHAGLTVRFGASETPGEPECDMTFSETATGTFSVLYEGALSPFYPYILAFTITSGNGGITNVTASGMTLRDANNDELILIGADANATAYLHDNGFCTIELAEGSGITRSLALTTSQGTMTLNFSSPVAYTNTNTTSTPSGFEGYLPVGQFATGSGWGSPYSSGTTPKIVGGYTSTGLSLGAPGGYAEYDMAINNYETVDGVSTKIQRRYGVDFVVYGNAFVGNPEAGSVKVYGVEKGKTVPKWYELAGSLYYSDVTLRDVTVTYKKIETDDVETGTGAVFTTAGIWYRIDDASNTEITGWTKFNQKIKKINGVDVQQDTTVAWWPEEAEGYLGTNGVYGNVDDVVVDTTANTIAYKHVTIVKDTDTTADYAFGYFDITPNGSSYGTAVNPYVYGTTGGNGYDLDWAVDSDGTPVELSSISKIRVYSSAGMKTDGSNLFTIPAVFGETSAELCGIYAASGTAIDASTGAPTIKVNGTSIAAIVSNGDATKKTICDSIVYYNAAGLGLTSSTATITATPASGTTAIIYINNEATGSYTKSSAVDMVRIVAQTGDGAPYIAVIKF
ncbi:MAG: hypothetical protein IKQ73_04640 [Oscillospiraceae bacterium]|nr:hypothetical protein [Oscillospiraceae bacterium]